jgi:hypothetical protein
MDPKGAEELARVLLERNAALPDPPPVALLTNADAAPIFHWLGIEPPAEAEPPRRKRG